MFTRKWITEHTTFGFFQQIHLSKQCPNCELVTMCGLHRICAARKKNFVAWLSYMHRALYHKKNSPSPDFCFRENWFFSCHCHKLKQHMWSVLLLVPLNKTFQKSFSLLFMLYKCVSVEQKKPFQKRFSIHQDIYMGTKCFSTMEIYMYVTHPPKTRKVT